MNERVTVVQANSLPLANLVRSHVVRVAKPQSDQAITLDLSNGTGTKLDLSAVANEKMTLVHVDTKLVILFDNQSTVTAEPFFDLSGRPLADLSVELSAGRTLNGEQFAQNVPITDDQSVLPANDPSSGANFHDVSIDSLPGSMPPLVLIAEDMLHTVGQFGVDAGADFGAIVAVQQLFSTTIVGSAPGIGNIPAPGGAGTQVFEAGLLASRGPGESAGTQAGNPAFQTTTRAGTISFTSPDGVDSVTLGGNHLNGTPTSFPDSTTGSLTAWFTFDAASGRGQIHYTYTLLDNTIGIPNTSLAVVVTDPDGDHNPAANLVLNLVDDAPIAAGDTDAVALGQLTPEIGDVIHGRGGSGADVPGADGGLTVVSATGTGGPVAVTAAGSPVTGEFGTLTLFSNGLYSYSHTGAPGGGTDTFTYTISDADGSRSTATLQIAVGDSAPGNISVPTDVGTTTVFEAGLLASRGPGESAGSDAGNPDGNAPTTTQTGKITFTSVDGVGAISLGGQLVHLGETKTIADGTTGELDVTSVTYNTATGTGELDYTYTLLDNTSGSPANGGDITRSFTVAVTDADGSTTTGNNLVISIRDDKPIASADNVELTGNDSQASGTVITNDVLGADGPAPGGAVVGIASNNNSTTGTVGVGLTGAHGTLTIDAQGQYTYTRTSSGIDTFTYTIQDGDGSQSNATLTFTLDNPLPSVLNIPQVGNAGAGTLADEAGLATGSNPAATSETTSGAITFTSLDDVGSITIADPDNSSTRIILDSGHTSDTLIVGPGSLSASYTIDASGHGAINYTYTLLQATSGNQAVNGGDTATSFNVTVVDTTNDQSTGILVIDIKDDNPVANPDTDLVGSGQLVVEHGNVLDGTGTTSGVVDILGADGAAAGGIVVGVASGSTPGTVGQAIHGAFGTLTLFADGHYNYQRDIGVPGSDNRVDSFLYTIQDGDGSQATATLNITVANSAPGGFLIPNEGDAEAVVFEAGLPARTIGGIQEPAGSNLADQTVAQGSIEFTSADGVGSVTLGGHAVGTASSVVFADATGSLSAFFTFDASTGFGEINYAYTLLDNTGGNPVVNNGDTSVSFAVAVTDLDSTATQGGNLVIDIVDDKPVARPDTDAVAANQTTPETGNVLTGVGTGGGPTGTGVDIPGADYATVVSVAINGTAVSVDPAAGALIAGAHGNLTIDAHGNYSYVRSSGGTDIFNYTVQDGDGSQSSSALTIVVGDSVHAQVFEAGLPMRTGFIPPTLPGTAGSNPGDPIAASGAINFASPDGIGSVLFGNHPLTAAAHTFTDATGSLTASFAYDAATGQGAINYSYILQGNTLGDPSMNNGDTSASFAAVLTDSGGNRISAPNLVIDIVDDKPIAINEANQVRGFLGETDGSIFGFAFFFGTPGADGIVLTAKGLAAGDSHADLVDSSTLGVGVHSTFGTLTLSGDGSYNYVRDNGAPRDGVDVYTYTIADRDGSLSHATLSIGVAPDSTPSVSPPAPAGVDIVFETALPSGSNPLPSATTTSGLIGLTALDGIGSVSLAGHTLTNADQTFADGTTGSFTASYTYNADTGAGQIHFTYTLLHAVTAAGDRPFRNFEADVTDTDGESSSGTLSIAIVDDAPAARGDSNDLSGTQVLVTGNVLTNDIRGADSVHVVGIAKGGNTSVDLDGSPMTVDGQVGQLHMNDDGTYTYISILGGRPNPLNELFTYTLKDADGDFSDAVLTIHVAAGNPGGITSAPSFLSVNVGAGSDTLAGGGANHFQINAPSDGGTIANQAGADHIIDFNAAKGDVIDILGAAFGNIAPGTNAAAIFGSSATDTFASPAERLHFNTETHTLLYDSNGSGKGGVQAALAVFDNHAIVAATNIHVI